MRTENDPARSSAPHTERRSGEGKKSSGLVRAFVRPLGGVPGGTVGAQLRSGSAPRAGLGSTTVSVTVYVFVLCVCTRAGDGQWITVTRERKASSTDRRESGGSSPAGSGTHVLRKSSATIDGGSRSEARRHTPRAESIRSGESERGESGRRVQRSLPDLAGQQSLPAPTSYADSVRAVLHMYTCTCVRARSGEPCCL